MTAGKTTNHILDPKGRSSSTIIFLAAFLVNKNPLLAQEQSEVIIQDLRQSLSTTESKVQSPRFHQHFPVLKVKVVCAQCASYLLNFVNACFPCRCSLLTMIRYGEYLHVRVLEKVGEWGGLYRYDIDTSISFTQGATIFESKRFFLHQTPELEFIFVHIFHAYKKTLIEVWCISNRHHIDQPWIL